MKPLMRTISTKVMLVFSVVILLLAAVMLFINDWSESRLEEELNQALLSQNQYFLHVLGRDLRQISQRQKEITTGEPLKRLVYLPTFLSPREIQYNVQWLTQEMVVLRDVSALVKGAHIYVQDKENPIFHNYSALFEMDEDLETHFAPIEGRSQAYWFDGADFHFTLPSAGGKALEWTDYVVDITLSNEAVQTTLDQLYMGRNGLVALADSSFQWSIGNSLFEQSGLTPQAQWLSETHDQRHIALNGTPYLMYQERLDAYDLVMFALYPEHGTTSDLVLFRVWYWITITLAAAIILGLSIYLHRQIHKPMRTLMKALVGVGNGDLDMRLHYNGRDEFAALYSSFNATVAQLRQSIDETYAYKLHAREAELKQLQSQINPHFLYNCFYVIYNMAQVEDTDSVMAMTQYLSQYYQYVFESARDKVPLAEDLKQAMAYIKIQIMRFGDRFEIHCDDIPAAFRATLVPRLIFQPLVENSFVHGFREKPGGHIYISFLETPGFLQVQIEDNGTGMPEEALGALAQSLVSGDWEEAVDSGLHNVNQRLRLFYGEDCGLHVGASSHGGLCVKFKIKQ